LYALPRWRERGGGGFRDLRRRLKRACPMAGRHQLSAISGQHSAVSVQPEQNNVLSLPIADR
jgi:hypothetical protein